MKFARRILIISLITAVMIIAVVSIFSFSNAHEIRIEPAKLRAEKINLAGFTNLYKINDSVYRSEQPGNQEMKELEIMGIKTILNLRNYHTDNNEARNTNLVLERIAMNAGEISTEQILKAMQIIRKAKKPILIHCLHGSDRTGCMVASYRIVFQNWTKEEAIEELRNPVFGYHESWFPNILVALNSLDVAKMKNELGIAK